MGNCKICNNNLNILNTIHFENGDICKVCMNKLPVLLKKVSKSIDVDNYHMILKKYEENKTMFSETSAYGSLHLDEIHALFKINCDVFDFCDIEEFYFEPKNYVTKGKSVYANIVFMFKLKYAPKMIETVIKSNVKFDVKNEGNNKVSCILPKEFVVFREMLYNSLSSEALKINLVLNDILSNEIKLAQAVFMLDDKFTLEDVQAARNNLIKIYHPDNNNIYSDQNERASENINYYYTILKQYLSKNKE